MEKKLQITATAKVQQASSELKKLQSVLTGTGEVITRVGNIFDKNGNRISKTIVSTEQHGNKLYRTIKRIDQNGVLRNLSTSITDVSDKADKTANIFSKWKNALSFTAVIAGVKALSKAVFETTTKAIDYSESLNLFNVVFKNIEENGETTFSKVGKEATEFQEKLQRNFGANRTESMYFQGLYQSMASSQGIAEDYANIMSENSTKLTYDLSSLFNANQADTAEALRAGIYAGQTKPLRSYGIDITENTLQATLDKMKETNSALDGLSVSSMSQAEKQILRYISVLEQASVAHGDFANTINSPANQLKILQNQFIEMSVAIGNLFLAPLQRFLTLANTVVIVVKQVANSIASLFGIKSEDYNEGIVQLGDAYDDFGDSVDDASGKVGKLKRQILGFDQINNISEPSNTGSGNADNYTGINQALLDSLTGYDNGLDKVKLKAQEIADKIMTWLGFTYNVEKETWELGKAYDNVLESSESLVKSLGILKGYTFVGLINLYKDFLEPVSKWSLGTGLPKFIEITSSGILKTDWNNLNEKLDKFYRTLTPFSINIGEGLLWFYEKVLTPLGSFTIGNVVPEFVEMLANGLTILNNTIEVIGPAVSYLWDNFLEPIGEWTGGIVVSGLKDINSVLDLIGKNKAVSTITSLSAAFLLVKSSGVTFNSILNKILKSADETSDSLSSAHQKGLGKIVTTLSSKFKDFISPTTKLISSIKNASTESGKFTTKLQALILKEMDGTKKTKTLKDGVKELSDKFKNAKTSVSNFSTKLSNGINTWYNTTSAVDKLKTGLTGLGTAVVSIQGVTEAMKGMATEGANFGTVSTTVVSGLSSIASSAMTGASVGGVYGAVIGGVVGAVGTVVGALKGWKDGQDELNESMDSYTEKMQGYKTSLAEASEQASINAQTELAHIESVRGLSLELESLIDSNGRVKSGYEDRVNYILNELNKALGTEYQLVGNVIYNNGQLVSSYKDIESSINDVIVAKKGEIVLNQYESIYYQALQNKIQAEKDYATAIEESEKRIQKAIDSGKSESEITKIRKEEKKKLKDAEKEYESTIKSAEKTIQNYNNLTVAVAKKDSEAIEKATNSLMGVTTKSIDELKKSWEATDKTAKKAIDDAKKKAKEFEEYKNSVFKNQEFTIKAKGDFSNARAAYNRYADDVNKSGGVSFPKIPAYANGGFPEDGPFFMNRGEIAGKFSNGKSVVANNQQITEGIKYAVMDGMSEVMRTYGGTSTNVHLDITTDEGIIVKKAVEGINKITETTGECPIAVV